MSGWRRRVGSGTRALEARVDRWRLATRRRLGRLGRFGLHPYLGYGTTRTLHLTGRVLRGDPLVVTAADTVWRNLRNMVRRLDSDEIAFARVRGRHAHLSVDVIGDDEGYFTLDLDLSGPPPVAEPAASAPRTGWVPVELELLDPLPPGNQPPARATGQVLVPRAARFGVISDLDDTVIRSEVTDTIRMLRVALTSNPHTRLPFEGVADFYRALEVGPGGQDTNPVFYVSASPWNFHDLFVQFMTVHRVPLGPLMLRDWSPSTVRRGGRQHKLDAIRTLMDTYDDLSFVMIGDSGELDPEIYAAAARDFPGRVRAVYIREVTTAARHREVLKVGEELRDLGAELVLSTDTRAAAEHARRIGLIGG